MSVRLVVSLLALGGLVSADLQAQGPLDFSGHWSVTPQGGGRGGGGAADAGRGWGPTFTIVQRGDTLIVERAFFSPGDLQPPLKFRFALDGSESRNEVLMGRGTQEQVSTAQWDGDTLVIVTRHVDPGMGGRRRVTGEVRRTLSYRPAGREAYPPQLVIESTRSGMMGGTASTVRTVYTRG